MPDWVHALLTLVIASSDHKQIELLQKDVERLGQSLDASHRRERIRDDCIAQLRQRIPDPLPCQRDSQQEAPHDHPHHAPRAAPHDAAAAPLAGNAAHGRAGRDRPRCCSDRRRSRDRRLLEQFWPGSPVGAWIVGAVAVFAGLLGLLARLAALSAVDRVHELIGLGSAPEAAHTIVETP